MLPSAEAHYLRHVINNQEWPEGTTLADYVTTIRQVVQDLASGVLLSRYQDALQVGFMRRAGALRGPGGFAWVLVEYRVGFGHWTTAYQLDLEALYHPRRSDMHWLIEPQ